MDSATQAEGEKRVQRVLIEPLVRRGLGRPGRMTKAQFSDMLADVCARLAYMTEDNLAALEDQAAHNPGGKEGDRFPIGHKILEWAGQIQPPDDDGSPLIRAVFKHDIGREALEEGWAPELLRELKRNRRWPGPWMVNQIRGNARDAMRRMEDLDAQAGRGQVLGGADHDWRTKRIAQVAKCRRIADAEGGEA